MIATLLILTLNAGAREFIAPQPYRSIEHCLIELKKMNDIILPELEQFIVIKSQGNCHPVADT